MDSRWQQYVLSSLNLTSSIWTECTLNDVYASDIIESSLDISDNAAAFYRIINTQPIDRLSKPLFKLPLFISRTCPAASDANKVEWTREVSASLAMVAHAYGFPLVDLEAMLRNHLDYEMDGHHYPAPIMKEVFNVLLNVIQQRLWIRLIVTHIARFDIDFTYSEEKLNRVVQKSDI